MKKKWFYPLIVVLLLLLRFSAFAQDDTQLQVSLKLTDLATNTSHTYKLAGVSYAINNNQDAEVPGFCYLTLEMGEDPDEFLLNWIAGKIKNAKGLITSTPTGTVKKPRNLAFTGGQISGSSESFYMASLNTSPQININVKTLSVDGVSLFTMSKTAQQ